MKRYFSVFVALLVSSFGYGQKVQQSAVEVECQHIIKSGIRRGALSANVCWLLDSDKHRPNPHRSMHHAIKELGAGALRFPYGHLADNYLWNGHSDSFQNGHTATIASPHTQPADWEWAVRPDGTFINAMDFDEYMAFCKKLDIKPLVVVNAISFKYKDGPTLDWLVKSAQNWVRYANSKGYKVAYWQIGNEVDHHPDIITKREFIDAYKQIAKGMKEVDPTANIGPGILSKADFFTTLNQEAPELVNFTSCHQYMFFFKKTCGTYDKWRAFNGSFIPNVAKMQKAIEKAGRQDLEIVVTETGITSSGYKFNNVHAGLWWFEVATQEMKMPNVAYSFFWGTHSPWHGPNDNDVDLGLLFRSDDNSNKPIADVSTLINANLCSNIVESSSSSSDVTAFAMTDNKGKKGAVFLSNKSGVEQHISLAVKDCKKQISKVKVSAIYGDTHDSRSFKSSAEQTIRKNGNQITIVLKPYSLSCVRF